MAPLAQTRLLGASPSTWQVCRFPEMCDSDEGYSLTRTLDTQVGVTLALKPLNVRGNLYCL
jgi:hypothetical protein